MDIAKLRDFVESFVAAHPSRTGVRNWWRRPLLVTARADDRFLALPRIAADDHLLPADLLATARSVVVFFLPFTKELVKENSKGPEPCHNWGLAYVQTNDLIGRLGLALAGLLEGEGYNNGLTPATHNFDEIKLMARWSHKHLAHLAGLGRFGHNSTLITPSGCAGRLGSLVTEADLGDHPLIETDEACLLKTGKECGQCIQACPPAALTEAGFDRRVCWNHLNHNRATLAQLADLPEDTDVCGKCQALLPCSFKNPVAGL